MGDFEERGWGSDLLCVEDPIMSKIQANCVEKRGKRIIARERRGISAKTDRKHASDDVSCFLLTLAMAFQAALPFNCSVLQVILYRRINTYSSRLRSKSIMPHFNDGRRSLPVTFRRFLTALFNVQVMIILVIPMIIQIPFVFHCFYSCFLPDNICGCDSVCLL